MPDWRPINTAPKDGSSILLWGRYAQEPTVAAWDRGQWRCKVDGASAIEYMSDFGTDWRTFECPSHWMPLPTPPVTQND